MFDSTFTRRRLLALTAASVPVSVLWPASSAFAATDPMPSRTVEFTRDWQFTLVNTTGVDAPLPGNAEWRPLNLPHDWSIGLDPVEGPHTTSGTGFLPGGLGWYRKEFTLPASMAGKKISIEFDGVYMDSAVYFNGREIGSHPYGYTGFALDLTPLAHTDGNTANELLVKVRNQLPSSRWYSGSGIYRDVRLIVTDPVHVVRHGLFATTPRLAETAEAGFATVHVRTTAVSEAGARKAELTAIVRDSEGTEVTRRSTPVFLEAEEITTEIDLRVDDPVLWSTEQPYLYQAEVTLAVDGEVVDATSTPFGMRWFRFDSDHGFSLNGKGMKLQGVNLHHDLGALGAATHYGAILRQLRLMRSMGVNALRTSHNPPSPQVIRACEESGMLMQVEAFDCWTTPKTDYDYGRFFGEHSDADLAEMVNAARNSPAVVMWSIGNEIPDSTEPIGVPIARRLIDGVRALDPTRPVVMGSNMYRALPEDGSPEDEIMRMVDGMGLNYNTALVVDQLHAKYPDKFLFESESSSQTSTRGVYDSPDQLNTGENYAPGKRGASSYDNNLESWTYSGAYGLKKDRDRPFFAGQFLWVGIDYIGEPTPYDVFPVKTSFFGAMDTAGFPKDQYYLFRSQWTNDPMVHLVPMNWTDHLPGEQVTIWTYSNVQAVELILNGRSLGERRFDRKTTVDGQGYLETTEPTGDDKTVVGGPYPGSYTSPNGSAGHLHLTWTVPFEPGELVAVAKRDGTEVARDVLRTAGEPANVRLTSEEIGGLSFVTAEIVDARGVLVPSAEHTVTFHAHDATVLGTDSGQQESAENYQSASRKAFKGRALAIVPAGAHVTATARGLRAPQQPRLGADASYSGAVDTMPSAMLDGNPLTAWSNHYVKEATALLPAVSKAHPHDWVSVAWEETRRVSSAELTFVVDSAHAKPAAIEVSYWNGRKYVPIAESRTEQVGERTRIAFAPVTTASLRFDLTSAHPGEDDGFLGIAHLRA